MREYRFVLFFAITIPTSLFIPTPLDDLNININLNKPNQGWTDDEFEADDNEPSIVIIGGMSKDNEILKDAEIAEDVEDPDIPEDRKWKALAPQLDKGRYKMAVVAVKNTLYVIGGKLPDMEKHGVKLFTERNADENKWKELSELKKARFQHTATAFDTEKGAMIVVTGGDGGENEHKEPAKSTELYSFEKKRWEIKDDLNYGRCAHAAVSFEGTLYVMGGREPGNFFTGQIGNIVERFTDQISWEVHSFMNEGRESHGAVVAYNKMYVCGGKFKLKEQPRIWRKTCEFYNEKTKDWWTDKYEMKVIREGFGLVTTGSHPSEVIWAVGGYTAAGYLLKSVEFYKENVGWKLDTKNFLTKTRMFHGIALYIPHGGAQARTNKLESANVVNSTFV